MNTQLKRNALAIVPMLPLLCLGTPEAVRAQDSCSDLLRHGIYDYFRDSDVRSSASAMRNEICTAYNAMQRDIQQGSAQASYGLFAGSVSLSRDQLSTVASAMCSSSLSDASASSQIATFRQVISSAGAEAFTECMRLNADGLRSRTEFSEDYEDSILIELRYAPPAGGAQVQMITGVAISPPNALTCQGRLWDLRQNGQFQSSAVAMQCTRPIANEPILFAGRQVLAPPVRLSVMTTAGTVTRELAAVPPPVTADSFSLGSVVGFAGRVVPPGWHLCDGAALSRNTYKRLFAVLGTSHGAGDGATTFNLPDYRGRFLRGVAHGMSDRDPELSRRVPSAQGGNAGDAVGSLQGDATRMPNNPFSLRPGGSHAHSITLQRVHGKDPGGINGWGGTNAGSGGDFTGVTTENGSHSHTVTGGDNETRPTNIGVEWIIRIEP